MRKLQKGGKATALAVVPKRPMAVPKQPSPNAKPKEESLWEKAKRYANMIIEANVEYDKAGREHMNKTMTGKKQKSGGVLSKRVKRAQYGTSVDELPNKTRPGA